MANMQGDAPVNDTLNRALIAAAWRNDVTEAASLIAQGADVNAKDATVQSAYLIATSEGFLSLLALTLANGADVVSKDSYNGTGLIRAADRGHTLTLGMLLRAGPTSTTSTTWGGRRCTRRSSSAMGANATRIASGCCSPAAPTRLCHRKATASVRSITPRLAGSRQSPPPCAQCSSLRRQRMQRRPSSPLPETAMPMA
jgi:hypothetical protein